MNQQNQDFDDLIRKRLGEGVPPEKPADGWEQLSEKMDADADIQLRAALSGLSIDQHAMGWEHLEQKLDPLSIADAQLADKLTGLEPAALAGSWEQLSERIDDEVGQEVDAVVVTQLNQNLAGAPSGWAALAARLELIGQRRSMVAAWKITEVSLLLSLLLLFIRFGPETAPPVPVLADEVVSFPIAANLTLKTEMAESIDIGAVAIEDTEGSFSTVVTKEIKPRLKARAIPPRQPALVLPMPAAFAGEEERVATIIIPAENDVLLTTVNPVASIEGLEILPLNRSLNLPSPAIQLPKVDHSEPVRYYANVYSSPFDFNQVVTPANAVREIDISGDDRITRGMSIGFLLDISQGKNGLQVGAIFGRRSYIPTALKWYLEESYPLIEPVKGYSRFIYETISFPLSYQRTFSESDRWRFSGRVGMNMTVIARSSFSIPTEDQELLVNAFNGRADLPGPPPTLAGEENNGGGRSATTSGSSSRKLVNPDPGWLEGGSMLANSSFYLGGGLQIERLLSPRWSIYVSPSFGRVIYLREKQGIGPYNDRIHTGSIRFGGRYLLSGK